MLCDWAVESKGKFPIKTCVCVQCGEAFLINRTAVCVCLVVVSFRVIAVRNIRSWLMLHTHKHTTSATAIVDACRCAPHVVDAHGSIISRSQPSTQTATTTPTPHVNRIFACLRNVCVFVLLCFVVHTYAEHTCVICTTHFAACLQHAYSIHTFRY